MAFRLLIESLARNHRSHRSRDCANETPLNSVMSTKGSQLQAWLPSKTDVESLVSARSHSQEARSQDAPAPRWATISRSPSQRKRRTNHQLVIRRPILSENEPKQSYTNSHGVGLCIGRRGANQSPPLQVPRARVSTLSRCTHSVRSSAANQSLQQKIRFQANCCQASRPSFQRRMATTCTP